MLKRMHLLFCGILTVFALQLDLVKADCGVVTRDEWDSLKLEHVQYLARPVDLVVIMETGTRNCVPGNRIVCSDIVSHLQMRHMTTLNYTDIGFSFLVGGNFKVYEGAGWTHVANHTSGFNKIAIGVAFIGNYDVDIASTRMLKITKDFLQCGVENGHLTPDYQVVTQSQLISETKSNPGKNLYEDIIKWPNWEKDVTYIRFAALGTRNAR